MKSLKIILIVVFCFWSCNDNSTGSGDNDNQYSFNLNVTDDSGDPLSDLEFWVKYGIRDDGGNSNFGRENSSLPVTTIEIDIAEASWNVLSLYNINGDLVDTLVDTLLSPGYYSIVSNCWPCDTSYKAGVKVFKYELTATNNSSGEILFNDYKYMVLINGAIDDNQLSTAGFTDENGLFETNEKIWFPTLYELPIFKRTDEVGNDLGDFTLNDFVSDTIEVRILKDSTLYTYNHHIVDGPNNINIEIYSSVSRELQNTEIGDLEEIIFQNTGIVLRSFDGGPDLVPSAFSLSQNYPNPYN